MRFGAASLVLLSLVVAGCSSPDENNVPEPDISDGDDDDVTPPSPPTTIPPTPPTPPAPPSNEAPHASLLASALTGDLPLDVEFTLHASDPDEDDLAWSFDADGDGVAED